jgi:hypothetical protein
MTPHLCNYFAYIAQSHAGAVVRQGGFGLMVVGLPRNHTGQNFWSWPLKWRCSAGLPEVTMLSGRSVLPSRTALIATKWRRGRRFLSGIDRCERPCENSGERSRKLHWPSQAAHETATTRRPKRK